jgi:outer membrane receptor protein involved in Fe transport
MMMQKALLVGTSVAALLFGGTAYGQTAPAPAPVAPATDAAPQEDKASAGGDIVVTGSRITRRDYVSDTPISTFSSQAIEAQGPATIGQSLNQLPQFAANDAAPTASGAKQGRTSANLRGLGDTRTLVLLDGRRLQPSDSQGTIDLNIIPTSLISATEVITGGASATYGSDAIAGVVNFKLKTDFKGIDADVQSGITERGDGRTLDASLSAGTRFADGRGRIMGAVSYFDREGVFGGARDFFLGKGIAGVLRGGVVSAVANNLPSQAALNSVFNGQYGATTTPIRNQSLGVNRDGTLFTSTSPILNLRYADHDPYIVDGTSRVGYPLGETFYLSAPLERISGFGTASFDVTPSITVYAQGLYTTYSSSWTRNGNTATSATAVALIPVTNPFISPDLRTILNSRPDPNAPINFSFNTGGVGPTLDEQRYKVYQAVFGVRGKIAPDINFDLYGSKGKTTLRETQDGYIDRAAWSTLVNAPDGGASVCSGGYNPFSPDPLVLNPAKKGCFDFLDRKLTEHTSFSQEVVEGTIEGGIMKLPGGDLRFAVGASYRRNGYSFNPDIARVNRTVYPDQATGPASGSINVKEVFGELLVPVLKDVFAFKELSLDVAYRYSDYSTVGGVSTYKATGDWNVFGGFRLRGGYQRAVRAPNLSELYAPPEKSLPNVGSVAQGQGDFCDVTSAQRTGANAANVRKLCLAQGVPASVIDQFRFTGSAFPTVSQGNLDLTQETADTITGGFTIDKLASSGIFHRLSISVDYYNIRVKDSIGLVSPGVAINQCFNVGGGNPSYDPNNPYCQLFHRDPTSGQVDLFSQQTRNLGGFKLSGIDTQLDWQIDLTDMGLKGDPGSIGLNLVASYLNKFEIQNTPGAPFIDYAGTIGNTQVDPFTLSYPRWKITGSLSYSLDKASITLRGRWYDSMSNYAAVGIANSTLPGVDSRIYFDMNARIGIADNFEFRFGVLNLLDKAPPEWTQGSLSDPGLYDTLQRRFFVGVNAKF